MTTIRKPCSNCPWRIDAPREYWDPKHFEDIYHTCQDDGMNVMACHKSREGNFLPCQGWARVMQFNSIGVRLAVMQGTLKLEEVNDCNGPRLFRTFEEMLHANKIKLPPKNRLLDK